MNRRPLGFLTLGLVLVGACFTGYRALGQTQSSSPLPPLGGSGGSQASAAVNGHGMVFSAADLKKAYDVPVEKMSQAHLAWTPEYRLTVLARPHVEPAAASAEMHEDKTQIYFILSGTGTQILGGTPAKDHVTAEGQHDSTGPLQGGNSYKIGPGDVVFIPPMTWHQTLPDAGQTIVYSMVHIETRTRMP